MNPSVSIQIVVRNGERYIRHCLNAVKAQTYPNIEVTILDNASTDRTRDIIAAEFPQYTLIEHPINLGMWPGQEFLLARTQGTYVLGLSVDVILDKDFVAHAVAAGESDPSLAAVQGKIYQYSSNDWKLERHLIDTCGFALARSRKVINIGHGQPDSTAYNKPFPILGVEGAVPFFRRSALEQCRIDGRIWDPDYFWYGDDLDLAWRMTLLGHRQMYIPDAIAWHDRSTTKGMATIPIIGQISRLRARRAIPLSKRRLDWSNMRFTIIKNDYIINILKDLPSILVREITVLGYTLLFELGVLREIGRFIRLLPRMIRRRQQVMARAEATPAQIRRFFL
jgi:GT2 family glycosyltransferase